MRGSSGDADRENRLMGMGGRRRKKGGVAEESGMETHTLPCVRQPASGPLLCDSRTQMDSVTTQRGGMGWEMAGRFKREVTYVLPMVDSC